MEQQVFGRVPRHRELGQQDHVGLILIARCDGRCHDARGIAVDVAHDQIELRHDATQLPCSGHAGPPKGMPYRANSCLD